MNSILRLMISRVMQADPDAIGSSPAAGSESSSPSIDDTIGALFDKMHAEGGSDEDEGIAAESSSEAAEEAEKTADSKPAGRARDATGKFAAKQESEGENVAETGKEGAKPATDSNPETPAAATQFADAPKSWNATERAAWATIPEAARAAAHRREEDFHRGIEQYRGKAQTFDQLHAVIAPHAEIFKASGQNAVENIGGLLNLQQVLYTGSDDQKIGTLLQIASDVGIKPEVLLQELQNPRQQPAQDPRYDTLVKRQEALEARLQDAQLKPVLGQTEAFLADPKNEFASDPAIQQRMLIEFQNGAKDLQEAYDNACWADRNVRAKIQQKTAEAERKAQAEREAVEAKRKADLAAKAKQASSINVKPRGATAGPAAKGTMDDTIASIYDRIHGSGS
jgi:hypothetical protein